MKRDEKTNEDETTKASEDFSDSEELQPIGQIRTELLGSKLLYDIRKLVLGMRYSETPSVYEPEHDYDFWGLEARDSIAASFDEDDYNKRLADERLEHCMTELEKFAMGHESAPNYRLIDPEGNSVYPNFRFIDHEDNRVYLNPFNDDDQDSEVEK